MDWMFEAVIQIFHLHGDVVPGETRSVSSSSVAHGSREVEIGDQQADGRTERLWFTRNDEAGSGLTHDLGCSHFGRDHHRNAASHRLEYGVTKIFRVRRQYKQPRCSEQALLFRSNNGAGQDANSVRDPQLCGKFYKFRSEILVGAHHS